MNDSTTYSPEEQVLADFALEVERLGPQGIDLTSWTERFPELGAIFKNLLATQRALEQSRPETDPALPERLGEFRIVRLIARSMGDVYEAIQEPLGRRVAVKTIRQGRVNPQLQARFLQEQRVLASLHQTHIVPIHTAGQAGPLQYFAMPYIEGAALHHVVQVLGDLQSSNPGSRSPSLGELARIATTDTGGANVPTVTHVGNIRIGAQPQTDANSATGRRRLSKEYIRSVVRVMADVAEAVQHAHDKQILHRDIKPSNIMVDTQEQSWIIDFGLARFRAQTAEGASDGSGQPTVAALTSAEGVVGTPQYMAPEQFEGQADERSDVYGLGVTLYELLTLQRAFDGGSLTELKRRVREEAPARPRTRAVDVPRDLEAVCLKAMEKEPSRRYETARQFATDLRRFLGDEPTIAHPVRAPRRVWKWARRNKGWAVAMLATAAAAILGLCAMLVFAQQQQSIAEKSKRAEQEANRAAEESSHAAAEARRAADESRRANLLMDVRQLRQSRRSHSGKPWTEVVWPLIQEAAEIRRDQLVQNEAIALLTGADARLLHKWDIDGSSIAYSADDTQMLVGGLTERAQLRLVQSGELRASSQLGWGPVAFSPSGDALQWIAESPRSFTLWNVSRQQATVRIQAPVPAPPDDSVDVGLLISSVVLAISRDGSMLAASVPVPNPNGEWTGDERRCFVWNDRGELLHEIDDAGSGLAFSPDNGLLAVGRISGTINLFSLAANERPRVLRAAMTLRQGRGRIHCVDFARNPAPPNGPHTGDSGAAPWRLAAGDSLGTVVVWDLRAKLPRAFIRENQWDVYAVRFSPDGMTLACGGRDGARLWDASNGRHILDIGLTGDFLTGLEFSPDGRRLAVTSQGQSEDVPGMTTEWSIETGRGIDVLHGMSAQVVHTCLSADGRTLVALAQNWEIGVYDLQPARLRYIIPGPLGYFADNAALAVSPDGEMLAVSSGNEALVWRLDTGSLIARHALPPGLVDHLAFTPEGELLSFRVECSDGVTPPFSNAPYERYPRVVRVRDLTSEDPLRPIVEITRFNRHVHSASVDPQGSFIVVEGIHGGSAEMSHEVMAFDSRSGAALWQRKTNERPYGGFTAIDPLGTRLALLSDTPQRFVIVSASNGDVIRTDAPPMLALGPGARDFVSINTTNIDGSASTGLDLHLLGGEEPSMKLGIDHPVHSISPRFGLDGNTVVFGTKEGLILVCHLREIERRLAELGFSQYE